MNFKELRNKYRELRYESYQSSQVENKVVLTFGYKLVGEEEEISFSHRIEYAHYKNGEILPSWFAAEHLAKLQNMVFLIGMAETISYWKLACPQKLVIACGSLEEAAIPFWKKLYYNGLGEFIYLNGIHLEKPEITQDSLVEIVSDQSKGQSESLPPYSESNLEGFLIPVGGGKDSVVTLELLRESASVNLPFVMSPPEAAYDCIRVAGYEEYLLATRILDKKIMEMNEQGYLNGHVPFSAILAFIASLGAALTGKKYIALSNEKSANEPSVPDTHFNHQYSKTLEFEKDFTEYFSTYGIKDLKYFSLLRPLYEIEIAKAFAKYEAYHKVFRSCNRGKKTNAWCGKCSKCLFVYIMLSPFIEKEVLAEIFGKDLFADKELLPILSELLGLEETKPFECVGTVWEVRYAMQQTVNKYGYTLENAPELLRAFIKGEILEIKPEEKYEAGDEIPQEYHRLVDDLICKEMHLANE